MSDLPDDNPYDEVEPEGADPVIEVSTIPVPSGPPGQNPPVEIPPLRVD